MHDDMTSGVESGHELTPVPDPSRALPVPLGDALPSNKGTASRSEMQRLGRMLEEAAGLALDALDVAGDAIAERLGLRRREPERPTDAS